MGAKARSETSVIHKKIAVQTTNIAITNVQGP